ncbi:hypothetical protein K0B96_17115 [Horticoccus luteus]|uniref:Glycosyl hydrolase family 43 n=1 Tax=Horticoccus luteus TaxID=2862869 RepID=A0A8F9XL98_9BACT|nr:hypothetical protein [Horticoccus luteus]QYM79001.1 hypothetical protein K0B96_17115 [Horticoccus luteus]
MSTFPLTFRLVDAPDQPVIGPDHPDLDGNKYGFEGGCFVKEADGYHAFMAEIADDPFNVRMRLAHWHSPDLRTWRRVGTLYETDSSIIPGDTRFSLWSPMVVFNDDEQRWNLFYVAYTPGEGVIHGQHTNGRIWRAISTIAGRAGVGGPYRDVGIVLQPDAESEPWEGQQATDSFYPWRVGAQWYSFYGGHNYVPPGPWPVGLAQAPALAGPWKRCPELNPSPLEPVFAENPLVTRVGAHFVAIYDNCAPGDTYIPEARHIGYSVSADGIHWPKGGNLAVQPPTGPAQWSEDIRTPLGLIAEDDGTFMMLYTGKLRGHKFWPVGLARLALA